jgi:hypothetical protein
MSSTSVGNFIDHAADALDGNGAKLHQTLAQLSGVGRILADGSGNIVESIKNLQTFVTALRDSNTQIVQFQDRLATLTSVLNGGRSDLDAALTNLSDVVGEVKRFIAETRDKTAEQVVRLADVTQNLVDHRTDLEQLLHVAPPSLANAYNMFDPRTGGAGGTFVLQNLANPVQFFCTAIGAVENATATETGKLCSEYLGPALRQLNFNYLPIPVNPVLTSMPPPDKLIYSEPNLAPGGAGPSPTSPDMPPAVSAYTGLPGDTPGANWPPPGAAPGPPPPAPSPAGPQPSQTLPDLLLPAERPPS